MLYLRTTMINYEKATAKLKLLMTVAEVAGVSVQSDLAAQLADVARIQRLAEWRSTGIPLGLLNDHPIDAPSSILVAH